MFYPWPQLTYLAIVLIGFGITIAKHGEPRTRKYSIGEFFLVASITLLILYLGGFFTP